MYKLWLIWLKNLRTYKTHNYYNGPYDFEFFSIILERSYRKNYKRKYKLIAIQNKATDIYHFDEKNFTTLDNMLDYILVCK